jgi:hypothetical protein
MAERNRSLKYLIAKEIRKSERTATGRPTALTPQD